MAHWQALSEEVLGSLPEEPRLWSAGCADGSEAYSLALLCLQRGRRPHVWATDVDDEVLERCRQATYRDDDLATVPEPLRRRYFRPHPGGGVEARSSLRSTVEVACHDALRDDLPARPFDLVACRNLVIYLGPAGREQLYERLARAVRPGGVLFTGAADSFHDADRFGFAHLGGTLFRRLDHG